MSGLEALILGIIQGIAEFLPISSSGHLVIGRELLGLGATDNIVFETMVHFGTVLSTITILRKEILQLFMKLFKFEWNEETQYIGKIFLSMIPVMIVGLFFKEQVKALFGEGILLVGIMLIVTALLLALTNFVKFTQRKNIGWGSSFIIGLAQAVAVMPGLSRSGTTIATGLLLGVKKEEVAKFSFLMVLIPILGETFLGIVSGDFSTAASGIPTSSLIIGFLASYTVGCIACKWMIELVKKANLIWFSLYCAVAGTLALITGLI